MKLSVLRNLCSKYKPIYLALTIFLSTRFIKLTCFIKLGLVVLAGRNCSNAAQLLEYFIFLKMRRPLQHHRNFLRHSFRIFIERFLRALVTTLLKNERMLSRMAPRAVNDSNRIRGYDRGRKDKRTYLHT